MVTLEHVRVAWEAEVENARRLSQRTAVLITIEAAVLGVCASHLTQTPRELAQRAWLSCSTALVVAGLVLLLRPRRRGSQPATASRNMIAEVRTLLSLSTDSALRARAFAIQQTVRAVEDLAARNARKQRDIDRAQIALLFAALTLLGGVFAGLILTSGR
ncbi:MAG: hypothetical protein U1F29_10000 [Planctomycetota bacterium]